MTEASAIAKLGKSEQTKTFLRLYDQNQDKEFKIENNTFQIYLCGKETGASTHYETVGLKHWKEQ